MNEFKLTTKPYNHQLAALQRSFGRPNFALLMEQGTGKSKIIIDEIVNLADRDQINCAIILAPNQLHKNWADQFEIHAPNNEKLAVQIWKAGASSDEKFVAETKRIIQAKKCLVFLMNIEAISTVNGTDYLKRILQSRRKSYMCIDESHKIKTPGAKRSKNAYELGKLVMFKRIATGTEAEEGVEGLYSQFKFLSLNIIGTKTYTAFKGLFCVLGGYEGREILGYQNQEVLASRIAPHTYQIRKKDCLDLPEQVYIKHKIEMTSEQKEIYNTLRDELLLEFKDKIIDATLVITRMLRLQQILCGHLEGHWIDSNRAKIVAELVESEAGKSIVFCRFRNDAKLVSAALHKAGIDSVIYSGDLRPGERDANLLSWRREGHIKALIATGSSGGVGLTLNESSNTIFYSNSWSATDRYQMEARNHRIGQGHSVTYHDIVVSGLVDDKLLRVLKSKQNAAAKFRSLVDLQTFLNGVEVPDS